MCALLGISHSGYYAWKQKDPAVILAQKETDLARVKEGFQVGRGCYGTRRIREHWLKRGVSMSRTLIGVLMKEAHLVARKGRKSHPVTTKQDKQNLAAPNLLNQNFVAEKPNQKWVGDITYIGTMEGWLFLAILMDLYSRRIVGWAMDERIDSLLVQKAWKMAIANRHPAGELIHHSDRGSQYTSESYRRLVEASGCKMSMSRTGNCYDNAAMESFYASLKEECAYRKFASRQEARNVIFEYIELWYNRQRYHSRLGYMSPVEFEIMSGH
jgi:transposase InsO family protein